MDLWYLFFIVVANSQFLKRSREDRDGIMGWWNDGMMGWWNAGYSMSTPDAARWNRCKTQPSDWLWGEDEGETEGKDECEDEGKDKCIVSRPRNDGKCRIYEVMSLWSYEVCVSCIAYRAWNGKGNVADVKMWDVRCENLRGQTWGVERDGAVCPWSVQVVFLMSLWMRDLTTLRLYGFTALLLYGVCVKREAHRHRAKCSM